MHQDYNSLLYRLRNFWATPIGPRQFGRRSLGDGCLGDSLVKVDVLQVET